MSLKSVVVTGRIIKPPVLITGKYTVANIYMAVNGGEKYDDVLFRVDCFGPIANKAMRDLSEGDRITIEGVIKRPCSEDGKLMNWINADKIHYEYTRKSNEVYHRQEDLFSEAA